MSNIDIIASTQRIVLNPGTSSVSIINAGPQGPSGSGILVKGTGTYAEIQAVSSPNEGDLWIQTDTTAQGDPGDGWVWNGVAWVNVGPIQGPEGPSGPAGADGTSGASTATLVSFTPQNTIEATNVQLALEEVASGVSIGDQLVETELQASINSIREEFYMSSIGQSQSIVVQSGDNIVDLANGTNVHVIQTSGTWTPVFLSVPSGGVVVNLSINVSANDHEPIFSNVSWYGTAPVTADWDINETNVIRLTKLPFVDKWIAEWIYNGVTSAGPITPPTLFAYYSTDQNLAGSLDLASATLPAGEVALYVTVPSAEKDIVESVRIFVNHTGGLPAIGSEGDSFVGVRSRWPYTLLGENLDESGNWLGAIMWDTNVDPTGNNRVDYNPNGATTVTAEATLVDGQTVTQTFSFNTGNAPVGATPTSTHSAVGYAGASSSHSIDIPVGVDRSVLVIASYKVSTTVAGEKVISSMTIGGNAMTEIVAATKDPASNQGIGQFVAYATEAQLASGAMIIEPTFTTSPGSFSSIIYDVWISTNVSTPTFGGDSDYINIGSTVTGTLTPSVASVPANSYLFTVACQQETSAAEATVNLGTATPTVEVLTAPGIESRSFTVEDSGVSATESATWSITSRSAAAIVYMSYVPSEGGGGVTPIIPGTPVIGTITVGDNQLTVPWSPTTDAVSYQIRWGNSNPPSTVPRSAVSPYVITGLASGIIQYVQVRAQSSTGHFSAWSAVGSGTPTGVVTPPGEWDGERYLVSYDHRDVMYIEGGGQWSFPELWSQRGFRRVNPASNEYDLGNIVNQVNMQNAMGNHESRGSRARPFRDACGPRLIISQKLAITGSRANSGSTSTAIAGQAQAILDTAKSGSKGSINRTDTWRTFANNVNRLWTSSGGQSYRGEDVVFVSIAHETNGNWAHAYTGTNTNLIGRPEFTASGGATATNYGSAMAAALIRVGETGQCDHVHRLATEHFMETCWSIQPKIIIGVTPAATSGSDPTTANNPGNLTNAIIEAAYPRPSLGFNLDFVCPTFYNRATTMIQYDGTGDTNLWSNYTSDKGWMEDIQEWVNRVYGCPYGLLELGGAYAIPVEQTAGGGGTIYDLNHAMFLERVLEHELINAPGKSENGLAFVCHWNFINWNNAGAALGGKTYATFNVMEGSWGRFPSGEYPSTTGKPSWSTRSTPMYPLSLDFLKSRYS